MPIASEAKSWFEGVQQILGMSVDRLFGMIAPALLAGWFLSGAATPKDEGWPTTGPFQWLASVSEAADISGVWATNTSEWITARDHLYAPCLITAALMTGLAHTRNRPTAFLGLASIAYAVALELQNSPWTLGWYLAASGLPCVVAIVIDAAGQPFGGYTSVPSLSFVKWMWSISIVAFSWLTIPFFVVAGAVEGYRVEEPVVQTTPPTGAKAQSLSGTPL